MNAHSLRKLQSIHEQLRAEILAGEWEVGTKLPKETEIAQRFDCSPGTVSKAVALLVHEGLVERKTKSGTRVVKNSIEPQRPASQLDAFAFIYPSEQHEGIWRTVKGFQDAARLVNRRVVMLSTGIDYRKEAEFIGRLSEFDVRGAVVYPVISTPQERVHFSQMLVNSKFPVVLAEVNLPGLGCSSVVIDGFHAGYTMAAHMIKKGAKQIGYFSNYAWAPFMRDRYNGYRWALQEAGMQEPEGGVFLDSDMHPDFNNPLAEPTRMAEEFFKKASGLDAVVCADDFLALGCIAAAEKIGLKVPKDLLVSGVDDYTTLTPSNGVTLTTYHVPFEDMGRRSFEVLQARLEGGKAGTGEVQIRGNIVVRESA